MLGMGEIQGCINLVQNVHRRRLELKEGHYEGKSDQRSVLGGSFVFLFVCRSRITHLCPPLNSVKLCFHTVPSWTLTSRPSMRSWPSGGWSFAKFPGRSSPKISPKSLKKKVLYTLLKWWRLNTTYLLTFAHVVWRASLLCLSIDSIVSSILTLSFSTVAMFFFKSASLFSTL